MRLSVRDVFFNSSFEAHFSDDRVTFATGASIPHATCYFSSGWVDLQVNGLAGFHLNAPGARPEAIGQIARLICAERVITLLPTIATASPTHIEQRVRAIAQACETEVVAQASIAGNHREGPCQSPVERERSAHDASNVHPPNSDEVSRWLSLSGTPYVAGSAISVTDAIQNAGALAGCSLEQAIQKAALNPAQVISLEQPESKTIFKWDASRGLLTVLAMLIGGRAD